MAAPTTALTTIKRFTYRGNPEEWSNHYMFSGTTPADTTAWRALFDALVAQEKTLFNGEVSIIRGYGYNSIADNATAVYTIDLTASPNSPVVGTGSFNPSINLPGDAAAWVRWGLDRLNEDGKRIYLRKYFHGVQSTASGGDTIATLQKNAYAAFGAKMHDGTFVDGRLITDKLGSAVLGHAVSTYPTTRTLKRRGKRPPT